MRILQLPEVSQYPNIAIWLDNCSGQNKNWTIFTTLACFMGERCEETPVTITLKYFEAGHTFMAADSFHALAAAYLVDKSGVLGLPGVKRGRSVLCG
ncbi:hypothetical protein ACHWQZ_G010188 [Mnemiopsis leidyi]